MMPSDANGLLESNKLVEVRGNGETSAAAGVPAAPSASARALARVGLRLFAMGRYEQSSEVFQSALALSPYDLSILNNLAVVYERAGRTQEAIGAVEQSLALARGQHDSWVYLGNLKRGGCDLDGAQSAYETALTLEAVSPMAWQGLGFIKRAQRKPLEAIPCFITGIKQSHVTAPLLAILGQLFYESGQFVKSRDAYAAAMEFEPDNSLYRQMHREVRFICAAIDGDGPETALETYQQECAARPGTQDKDVCELLQTTFALLTAHGVLEAAKRVGALRVALFPDSASAAYLLKAAWGDRSVTRSPDAYLVECFDAFADRFDEHLVETLGYEVPGKLAVALREWVPAGSKRDVLDVGCGTGLCGPPLRDIAASLTGVDLSPRMLDRARQRQVYDRLVCAEITSFLVETPASCDVVVAADVMIYFGDLVPLADALARALRPGGLLAFSTESTTADDRRLLRSGRFAHGKEYVESVFARAFAARASHETTIRMEALQPVAGNIHVFDRR